VRCVVVEAGQRSRQPLGSSWRLPRVWRSLPLAAVWAVYGCTLTHGSFEPTLLEGTVAANAPDPLPGMERPPSGGEPGPPLQTDGESSPDPVQLNPPGGNDERLGGSGAGSGAADAGEDAVLAAPEADAGDPTALTPACPSQAFGGSCYELFGGPASWSEAEQRCVDWGGHLAKVESAQEDAFLGGLLGAPGGSAEGARGAWLGGSDAAQDGEFIWADGSALLFDAFAPNQPDDGAGVDCIEKRNDATALWYDQRCTDEYPYICRRPL
jgi:lectin-like protein